LLTISPNEDLIKRALDLKQASSEGVGGEFFKKNRNLSAFCDN